MPMYADDDFLAAIAQQAQVAYAMQQVHTCKHALERWQTEAALEVGAAGSPSARLQMEYYMQQVERWQAYLGRLGVQPSAIETAASHCPICCSVAGR
jgi:hypothetical protein